MNNIKSIILTILVMVGLSLVTATIFFANQLANNWTNISFVLNHPVLVATLREQYASDSALLDKRYTTREKSADDQLKEAVAEQLKK